MTQLPPGFQLEQSSAPPLPPGFQLETAPDAQSPQQESELRPSANASPSLGRNAFAKKLTEQRKAREQEYRSNIEKQIPLYDGNIDQLEEIGASPEFNELSMPSLKSSLAANLIGNDFELAQSLHKQIPDIKFSRDEDLNLIASLPSGGSYYLNAPGLSGQDFAKVLTRIGGYALAGGGSLPVLAGKAALTETALQGGEKALGGDFNPSEVAIATVAAPVGQVVGDALVAPAMRAAPELIKRAFRGGEAGRANVQAAIDDFAEFGGSPSLGTATGDGFRQGIENISGRVFGGGPVRRSLEQARNQIQERLTNIADDISPVRGDTEIGRVVNQGITGRGGFIDRFQGTSGQLWRNFDDQIDDMATVDIRNTTTALNDLVSNTNVGQVLNNPLLTRVRDAIAGSGGEISYQELRAIRSEIGRRLSDNALIQDIPRAQLSRVYGALSQDLRALAEQSGDDAVRSLNRANTYTAAGHGRIDDFLSRVANKVDLDKVFQALAKGGEGVQQLNAFKRSLRPDEWQAVASGVIRRLGRATSGTQDDIGEVFSVNKFLTDWDKLGRSKDVLFSGSPQLNQYRQNLNRIASATNRLKQASASMANPSGTGQFVANAGALSTAGASIATGNLGPLGVLLAGVAANNGAARLMTSPRFVNWLAQASVTSNLPGHISRLATIAAADEQKEEILDFIKTIESMTQESLQRQGQGQSKRRSR